MPAERHVDDGDTKLAEPAGVWVRVSSGGQDEENQVPDVERHCETHGYRIVRRYELNDKSASKGEQQDTLDKMLHNIREGTIKVLVCWHSDRLERRGPEAIFRLLRQVKDASGRIESVQEPLFGTEDMSGEALTALGAVIAHQYSVHLGEQISLALNRIKANGAVTGRPPWGFTTEGPKYNKKLVPTAICREYVPQIFERCIAGHSLRQIAVWLDSEEVPTEFGKPWHESVVRRLIRARVYAGWWQTGDGRTITRCEVVVPADVWDRANHVLKTRPKRGPSSDNKPLLANLKCARCARNAIDSPMFRVKIPSWDKKRYYLYYRCSGRGAQRKGCGNMLPYDQTEIIIAARVFMTSTEPHRLRTWVEGRNWDAEISDVKLDMREAVDNEQFDKLPELQAKLAALRSRETVPGHWDYEDTGLTVGEYFDTLNRAGQREYLKTRDICVEKTTPEDSGATRGMRVIIDGMDHGVFAYPPARAKINSSW